MFWEFIYIVLCANYIRIVLFVNTNSPLEIPLIPIMLIPFKLILVIFLMFQVCVHVLEVIDFAIIEKHLVLQDVSNVLSPANESIEPASFSDEPKSEHPHTNFAAAENKSDLV